jgi:hypothetical protein
MFTLRLYSVGSVSRHVSAHAEISMRPLGLFRNRLRVLILFTSQIGAGLGPVSGIWPHLILGTIQLLRRAD